MGALLALASAVCYGVADVAGGLLSRRANPVAVAFAGQAGGLVFALLLVPFVPGTASGGDLAWGALSGMGTGTAMTYLYRGLARGAMSVVVPISAVGGVTLPVVAGVVLLGDRPSALESLGVAAAVPALWLVSRPGRRPRDGTGAPGDGAVDGLIAGAGIALQYLTLAQASPESGVWAIVAGRAAALLTIAPMMARTRERQRLAPRPLAGALGAGAVAALALVCYLAATRTELLVVAVVLASLYPVIPVLLGVLALHERPTRGQTCGLAAAAVATLLVTLG